MRRSSFRLVAAAAAIALAVTGCSSSSDDAANTDTQFKTFKKTGIHRLDGRKPGS